MIEIGTTDPVLVMYDIRGKQDFIYRSSKIKEIVGGSAIIRDCFTDYLYPAAIKVRNRIEASDDNRKSAIYSYNAFSETLEKFSFDRFIKRVSEEQYLGEVIYDGGGNFLILFKNREIQKAVTAQFTRDVIRHTGTLRVLCTCIGSLRPDHYHSENPLDPGDYDRLYQQHRHDENQITASEPYASLPCVQADYYSARPLTAEYRTDPEHPRAKITRESLAKYHKYADSKLHKLHKGEQDHACRILDHMVADTRGDSSLLSVIYMDGNSMGAKVQACLKGKTSYEDCVNELRRFSGEIQKCFVDDRKKDLKTAFREDRDRLVIGAGDEITIICKAVSAYKYMKEYLLNLPDGYSSCAGAVIFHSHTPFSDAYRIAEECCETGKIYMREHQLQNVCLMDFEYCQGAIGVSLDEIREQNEDTDNSRPWLVCGDASGHALYSLEEIEQVRESMDILGRSNIKGLLEPAMLGNTAFSLEIKRILSHMTEEKRNQLPGNTDEERIRYFSDHRTLIADLVKMYDVGFGKDPDTEGENR